MISIQSIPVMPDLADPSALTEAKKIFKTYQAAGTIVGGTFQDNLWVTTDQTKSVSLNMYFDKDTYEAHYMEMFQISYEDLCTYIRIFVIQCFGSLQLITIQSLLNDLRKLISVAPEQIPSISFSSSTAIGQLLDFLGELPIANERIDRVCTLLDDALVDAVVNTSSSQRNLATFRSYFRFNDILSDFWLTANKEEKVFFFPLFLWWSLTSVIPVRPTEFTLIPRDCLVKDNSGYRLILRKTRLKGGSTPISYTVRDDYSVIGFHIPEKLAQEIEWYKQQTDDDLDTSLGTLFSTDSYYRMYGRSTPHTSRYFTYRNLNRLLRNFYKIISDRYGLRVVYDSLELTEESIEYIQLGDTRHIAMINLILSGATPEAVMVLAGHKDIAIGAHYWGNISELVECKTFRKFQRLTGNAENQFTLSMPQQVMPSNADFIQLDKGRCFSPRFMAADITDCTRAIGPSGELGYCQSCAFYRESGWFSNSSHVYKAQIEKEVRALKTVIEKYRHSQGETEEIAVALTRLKSAALSYQDYLIATKGDKENAEN